MQDANGEPLRTLKKLTYPLRGKLREYLAREGREVRLPIAYSQLTEFVASAPLLNKDGSDSMWEIVAYPPHEMEQLNKGLTETYALLRGEGETAFFRHLYVDRIDYCSFGNSKPFRIRIVNAYNENPDYFYFKIADASRVYGLELEHLLSPNRMHYLTDRDTLVEEHVVGIPGDVFAAEWLNSTRFPPVRLAKEMIKFNERCLVRLLGDMRAYNFVIAVTPDFDTAQIRVRAMDFDQQSYNGRVKFYIPQYFKDNNPYVFHCLKYVNQASAVQYQKEELSLLYRRAIISADLLRDLLDAMREHPVSPEEKARQLSVELADYYQDRRFIGGNNMADLLQVSLERLHGTLREGNLPPTGLARLFSGGEALPSR